MEELMEELIEKFQNREIYIIADFSDEFEWFLDELEEKGFSGTLYGTNISPREFVDAYNGRTKWKYIYCIRKSKNINAIRSDHILKERMIGVVVNNYINSGNNALQDLDDLI